MRIEWSVVDESEHYVRLRANNVILKLTDLDELEHPGGLRVIAEHHHTPEELFGLGECRWAVLHILCRKNNSEWAADWLKGKGP